MFRPHLRTLRTLAYRPLVALVLLGALSVASAHAAIRLEVSANPSPALPGELLDLEFTVTNDGAFERTDLTLVVDYPDNVASLSNGLFDGACPSVSCTSGEEATFDIASLPSGGGISFSMPVSVANDAGEGTVIPWNAEVFDGASSEATATESVSVTATRALELALKESADPSPDGSSLRYTLTYGVREASGGSTNVVLELPLPPGVSFVSASDGGTYDGGSGTVSWALGNLGPGSSGERSAIVSVDGGAAAGSILKTEASLADDGGESMAYRAATRVQPDIPLRIEVVASPDPIRPGETLDLEITVDNTSPFDRTGVEVRLEVPDDVASLSNALYKGACASVSCTAGERAIFDVGTLPAGRGRSFTMPFQIANDVEDGVVTVFDVDISDSTGEYRQASATIATDAEREFELSLSEKIDPLVPDGSVDYVLSYGILDTSAGSPDATLRLPVPANTSFVEATEGGALVGDSVQWSLGALNPGESGEVRARFTVDPALDLGEIVRAEAQLDDTSGREVRYDVASRVEAEVPLELEVSVSPDPALPDERLEVELTVTNRGPFDRSGVEVALEIPDDLRDLSNALFDGACPSVSCDVRERAIFDVGLLPVGEGRTYTLPFQPAPDALGGTSLLFEAEATSAAGDELESGTALAIDTARRLDLALSESDEPLSPGSTLTYTLTFGTYESGPGAPGSLLVLEAPSTMSFVSASDGGSFFDGLVEWSLGSMGPGGGGDRTAVFELATDVDAGTTSLSRAWVEDSSGTRRRVRFEESTRVEAGSPLDVDLLLSPLFAEPGTTLDLRLRVSNEGALERTGVVARVEVPDGLQSLSNSEFDGTCPSVSCTAGERATFDIGVLGVGESLEYTIPFVVANATERGTVIHFDADVRDSVDFVGTDGLSILVGNDFDGGRTAGAGSLPDGAGGGTPLIVETITSCDDLQLSWGESCLSADEDYAVYEGLLGQFGSHDSILCSTGGETSVIITPPEGVSTYYLVVPQNGIYEGSYGRDSEGLERAPSEDACLPQRIATDCLP